VSPEKRGTVPPFIPEDGAAVEKDSSAPTNPFAAAHRH
jgi:hypothetical protein